MKNITTLILVFSTFLLFGQTGPGGVGKTDGTSALKVWYNPNNASTVTISGGNVTGLTNAAGVSVLDLTAVITAAPTFSVGSQNGYDEMDFTGSKLLKSATGLTTSNFVTNAASSFVVSNATNIHASRPYETIPGTGANRFLCHLPWNNGRIYFDLGNASTGRIFKAGLAGITNYNIWAYRGDSSNKYLYQNGSQKHFVNSGAATFTVTASTIFQIGKNYQGQMAEIIVFKEKIGQAERIIIDNYLAAKYGLSLEVGDYYTQDDSIQGNFDHNVAGIGQVSVTDKHIDSQGTGIVRISTPSSLANNDFLFWGEETKNPTYDFTTTTNYLEQLNSKWRVNKENDLGTVTVSIKESDIMFISSDGCNDLKLIVSSDSTFTTKTVYDMTLSGGVYTANLVSFANNDYFTFEYLDKVVVDGTGYYNGSGLANVPSVSDSCYKFLVKSTANGLIPQTEGCNVRELEVETNGVLVINDGLQLAVAGSIQLDGDIRLIGISQLLQSHTGMSQVTGSGKLYKDRESGLTNVYQSSYWTSPVAIASNTFTIAGAMKDGTIPTSVSSTPPNINFVSGYDGATTTPISISKYWLAKLVDDIEWNRHGSETTIYNTGEGYNMKSTGANGQNYTFVGKPNDGDYSISVTGGKSTLLGNPYPSVLDADNFLLNNTGIISTLYFWDGINDNSNTHIRDSYAGGYATRAIGIGTAYNGGSVPAQYMQVAQGFFVDADVSGTIQFKNSQRAFNTATPFFSKDEVNFPILRLGFDFNINTTDTFHRQLAVGFRGLTNDYESGYDAIMYDMRPTDISLKVNNHIGDFVITGIEDYLDTITVPLHIVLDQQRDVTFSVEAFENFTPDEIYLKDTNTNMYYNLNSNVSINLPAGDYTNRFEITFRQGTAAIANYVTGNEIDVIDNINTITINSKKDIAITDVQIFNVIGQKLAAIKARNMQIIMPVKLDKGQVLIVKITLGNGQTIIKKILKK